MKRAGLSLMIVVLIMSFGSFDANALEPNDIVLSYLQALKDGNIEAIKDSIAGELYKKRKVILEQNENYSEFLKKFYQDAEFQLTKTTTKDDKVFISVDVDFSGRKSNFTFLLLKNTSGNWKIYEEINE
jgi:hypothetical protein